MWTVTLEEDGDDLILPIPQEIMEALNLNIGDSLDFKVDELTGTIILSKKDDQ
jgi:bifunctional DNA-binding transcriptional regulator/antitoxin component of YhaV-PrlF toxin-antitoxin module